ncbi:MAG: response regulator [Candidatus Omnitrophota bacterium]
MVEKRGRSGKEKKRTILVVDDEIGIVSFLYDFFVRKGYDVLQATDANSALQTVKKENPDLVLLDIKLGHGKSGMDVLREIKEIKPRQRVIMMTGVTDKKVINEALRIGADDYMIKPFSLQHLERVVALKILTLEIERIGEGGG